MSSWQMTHNRKHFKSLSKYKSAQVGVLLMLSNKADNPTHCSGIIKYYTKLSKYKSAEPGNAHHKSGDKENNNVTSVQRVPEPDPIPGISFATRPDPIQF